MGIILVVICRARVFVYFHRGEKDPAVIEEYIERYRVSTMHFVPSMLSTFLDYMELYNSKRDVSSLIQVFTSGEALNTEQVRRFKGSLQCSANKVN